MSRVRNRIFFFMGLVLIFCITSVGNVYAQERGNRGLFTMGNTLPTKEEVLVRIGDKTFTNVGVQWRIDGLPPDKQKLFQTDQQKKDLLEGLVRNFLLALEAKSKKVDKEKGVVAAIQDMKDYQLAQVYIKYYLQTIEIPADDVKKYYNENPSEFKTAPMVNAQHILIKVDVNAPFRVVEASLRKANKIKRDLDKGADFAAEAKKYSDDPDTKDKGGEIGFFTKESMIPDFSDAAFSMKTGQISKPVRSVMGYHIIKVIAKKDAAQMSLEQSTPTIRTMLYEVKKKEAIDKEVDRLKKKYDVVYTK